jgi:hypothetical protein
MHQRGGKLIDGRVARHLERRLRGDESQFRRRDGILQQRPKHATHLFDQRIAAWPTGQHLNIAGVRDLDIPGLNEAALNVRSGIARHGAAEMLRDGDGFVPLQANVVLDQIGDRQRQNLRAVV